MRTRIVYTIYTREYNDRRRNCLHNNNCRFVGKSPLHRVLYMNIDTAYFPCKLLALTLRILSFSITNDIYSATFRDLKFMKINRFYFQSFLNIMSRNTTCNN